MTRRSRTGRGRRLRSVAFWAVYGTVYDLLWDNELADDIVEEVLQHLGGRGEVLEVGAGTGIIAARLERAGVRVQACEPSAAMRRRYQRRLPGLIPSRDGIAELRAGSVPSSAVVAVNVLHLCDDPGAALRHLRRVAGVEPLIVVTPRADLTLITVARAQRTAGVGRARVLRFVALHLLLVPWTAALGMSGRVTAGFLTSAPGLAAKDLATTRVVVFQGIADSDDHLMASC